MAPRLVIDGRKARQLREAANLKQATAALRLDLAQSRLRLIENGTTSTNLETLGKLATLYGVEPGDLLTWT